MQDRGERVGIPAATVLAAATMTGFLGAAGVTWAAIRAQAKGASRRVEDAAVQAAVAAGAIPAAVGYSAGDIPPPNGDGVYRPGGIGVSGESEDLTLAMLGDSTSVGYGCSTPDELPGVLLARRTAVALQLPVRLSTHGRVGAMSVDLDGQATSAIKQRPDLAVIVIGANDITGQVPPQRAARWLGAVVAALRAQGIEVVVGTCPDFGVIAPIPQPLRTLVTRWSHRLAVLQARGPGRRRGRRPDRAAGLPWLSWPAGPVLRRRVPSVRCRLRQGRRRDDRRGHLGVDAGAVRARRGASAVREGLGQLPT